MEFFDTLGRLSALLVKNTNNGGNIAAKGMYFITVTDIKTGKQEVSKFVVN